MSGEYARKHAPWTHFTNVQAQDSLPISKLQSYDTLRNVAFAIPNLVQNMHVAGIGDGDKWFRRHIDPLIVWAKRHDTLVIVT